MNTKKGFTLVELLVVIALLGVLIAIAVPSFLQSIRANSVKAKAEELVAFLRYARTESLAKKKGITVIFEKNTWKIELDNKVERVIEIGEITYSKNIMDNTILFISSGGVTNGADFLICKDNDVESAIYISLEQSGVINTYSAGKNKLGNPIASCEF